MYSVGVVIIRNISIDKIILEIMSTMKKNPVKEPRVAGIERLCQIVWSGKAFLSRGHLDKNLNEEMEMSLEDILGKHSR